MSRTRIDIANTWETDADLEALAATMTPAERDAHEAWLADAEAAVRGVVHDAEGELPPEPVLLDTPLGSLVMPVTKGK
jgi:hypothetical protein